MKLREQLTEEQQREVKRQLSIKQAAEQAGQHFITVFQKRLIPETMEPLHLSEDSFEEGMISISRLLSASGLVSSNSEARRSVSQGAVKINGKRLSDPNERIKITDGDVIQVGKRRFAKIVVG